jgi:gluconolactonase
MFFYYAWKFLSSGAFMPCAQIPMLYKIIFICLANNFASCNTTIMTTQTDSLFREGTKPVLISNQFAFTEGPAADKSGNIYFTDQPNDKIWKYSTDGKLTVFMEKSGRSNGLYFDEQGNLLSCADEENQLWSISPEKKVTVLLKDLDGRYLNGPNDLWAHPLGGIYFTDPLYPRSYWKPGIQRVKDENVYYLPPGKQQPVIADSDVEKPNGIIGTPDGKYLYVADIKANKTYQYEIGKDGVLQNRRLFVEQGSDGMTLDSRGNLYLTGKGVTVYDPSGKKIAHIDIPANWTANVCFGGKDNNKLFITASESVYVMDMLVRGRSPRSALLR